MPAATAFANPALLGTNTVASVEALRAPSRPVAFRLSQKEETVAARALQAASKEV